FAGLHRGVLNRTLEGEECFAPFEADAQHAAALAQLIVVRVEQVIFLQPAAAQRRGSGRQNRLPGFVGVAKPQLNLSLQGSHHTFAFYAIWCMGDGLSQSDRPARPVPEDASYEDI